ncbi:tetratricopeptide repeat protein [Paraburkholderia sp. C35]|uniref:O-linked N-acetylglucosamine transferase, SPINDLY family protein n=1 Tax=Paraburkholderia sp. C35 TaxID=2126993 RepID=UPI001EF4D9C0|nr:tetratricopeptide repeat protein [Paraburkholderia sp. C35]
MTPVQPDALHRLGLLACQTGQRDAGIALMQQSLAARPDAVCCNDLGIVLREQGRLAQAIAHLRQALALQPDFAEAHNNLGNALKDAGDLQAAEASYRKAIALRPDFAQAYVNLSAVLRRQQSHMLAVTTALRAVELAPALAEAHNNLGNAYQGLDDLAAAAASYRRALELNAADASVHHNLSLVLLKRGQYADALTHCRRAIAAGAPNASMHVCLGDILRAQGDLDGAIDAYRAAHRLDPDSTTLALQRLLFCSAGSARVTPQQFLEDALRHGRVMASRAQPFVHDRWQRAAQSAGRALRVGFVSPDLRLHPVGIFLENVLAHLDSTRVEPIAYATRSDEDEVSARLRKHFSAWHSLTGMDTGSAARRVFDDGIDILIDLAGHTAWSGLPMFWWKPAPVQASWIGFFATTGCEAMDYIIGDRHVLPASEQGHFVEQPWRLPESYLCFTPPPYCIDIAPPPMQTTGAVTFGFFGKLIKVTDDVIALWSELLRAVPRSRLYLKALELESHDVQHMLAHRFAVHGIAPERLILEGASPRAHYFEAYNRVDIALSPFPYSSGTTTVEALWMGVPVIALAGDRFVAHICESMLHAAGLAEWIAPNRHAYVAKAIALASDGATLTHVRQTLRARILASPLGDAHRFARNLESAFHAMWQRYLNSDMATATSSIHSDRH